MRRRNRFFTSIMVFVVSVGLAVSAQATLFDRGGGMIYDDDLDVTWLQDTTAGAGSIFDDGFDTTDGIMTKANARAWADALLFGGFNDWRLWNPDPSCGFAFNCNASEMGHLYYDELGNVSGLGGLVNTGLFNNLLPVFYWSSTDFTSNPSGSGWGFNPSTGFQGIAGSGGQGVAWAVRDGDILNQGPGPGPGPVVPEPATVLLFGTGLAGLLLYRRRMHP